MTLEGTFNDRVRKAIDEIAAGRMVILVDDEDRENEGDLVMAADKVTAEAVNFMARHGRGLICLTLTEEHVARLGLAMMVDQNQSQRSTAFTVSIEASEGVTTGISAQDRAHTVRVAVSPTARPSDLVSPGHIFPLRARSGGVLQRTGHTEGSVDLARLAGCQPAGMICEIMNEDGTMARLPDLEGFGRQHGIHILSIEDLVHYRLQREKLVRRTESVSFVPAGLEKTWTAHVYESAEHRQFLAMVLGTPRPEVPTLVRMHTGTVFADVFPPPYRTPGGGVVGGGVHLRQAMTRIEAAGCGVVVYIPPSQLDVAAEVRTMRGEAPRVRHDLSADGRPAQREYGLGAQVLLDVGVRRIRILTGNPKRFVGLAGYGLEVDEVVALAVQD